MQLKFFRTISSPTTFSINRKERNGAQRIAKKVKRQNFSCCWSLPLPVLVRRALAEAAKVKK
jgi:hypothetical protein